MHVADSCSKLSAMDIQEKRLRDKVELIKKRLCELQDMRPGALSEQYNVCGSPNCRCKDPSSPKKHGPYYQLSYTHRGKSTSEYVKAADVPMVKAQLKNYARFKKLTEEWTEASLQICKLRKEDGMGKARRSR